MSVEYYARLERGNLGGVSAAILDGIARALQLDAAEREHLRNLAEAQNGFRPLRPSASSPASSPASTSLSWMLESITGAPAIVGSVRMDLVGANRLGRALYFDMLSEPRRPANFAQFAFLSNASRTFYPEWEVMADITVALLRRDAGRDPENPAMHDLIGELSTRCEEFRTRWAAHNVRRHTTGIKRFQHAAVGLLELAFDSFTLVSDESLALTVYSAEPGSIAAERISLLGMWADTVDLPEVTLSEAEQATATRPRPR